MKRELPMLLALGAALFRLFLELSHYQRAELQWQLHTNNWWAFLAATAVFIGVINLCRLHIHRIRRQVAHWQMSVWCLFVMFSFGLYGIALNGLFRAGNQEHWFRWIFTGILQPADQTMFSLLAFYIASAAYRSFRVRNLEATVMMVTAAILMLNQASIGPLIWSGWGDMAGWFMDIVNAPAQRGLAIGIFLGSYAMVLRMFLGLERKHLGL